MFISHGMMFVSMLEYAVSMPICLFSRHDMAAFALKARPPSSTLRVGLHSTDAHSSFCQPSTHYTTPQLCCHTSASLSSRDSRCSMHGSREWPHEEGRSSPSWGTCPLVTHSPETPACTTWGRGRVGPRFRAAHDQNLTAATADTRAEHGTRLFNLLSASHMATWHQQQVKGKLHIPVFLADLPLSQGGSAAAARSGASRTG